MLAELGLKEANAVQSLKVRMALASIQSLGGVELTMHLNHDCAIRASLYTAIAISSQKNRSARQVKSCSTLQFENTSRRFLVSPYHASKAILTCMAKRMAFARIATVFEGLR